MSLWYTVKHSEWVKLPFYLIAIYIAVGFFSAAYYDDESFKHWASAFVLYYFGIMARI